MRVDDGPWQEATLGPDGGIDYWRQWYLPWDATPGRHDLTVRATDGTGEAADRPAADAVPRRRLPAATRSSSSSPELRRHDRVVAKKVAASRTQSGRAVSTEPPA